MVSAGCTATLVRGVRLHGAASLDTLRTQVELLSRIIHASDEYCKLVRDAGALTALRTCRDALEPDVVIQPLATLIASLKASTRS